MYIIEKLKREYLSVEDPLNLTYMKFIRLILARIHLWPHKAVGLKSHTRLIENRKFISCVDIIILVLGVLYIRHNISRIDFFELGNTYITVFMNIAGFQRILLGYMPSYHNLAREFIKKFHLSHFKTKSEYANEMNQSVHKICTFFTLYIHCQMCIGFFLFNMMPVYNNYNNGLYGSQKSNNATLEHAVYYLLPFDYQTNMKGYTVVFIFNWYITYVASIGFCYVDIYVCVIVFHIWGHFKILKHNLENFPKPKNHAVSNEYAPSWYDDEESEMITRMLLENIVYHKMITDFMTNSLNVFGYMLATYLAFHQVSGCILLLECSKLEAVALARYGPLTLILFQQLIQISIVFELIGSKSETLKESVYEVPWEYMNNKNRKILLMFLCNVQNKVDLKVLGVVAVGVRTMYTILKTSVSYFVYLRTFTSHE